MSELADLLREAFPRHGDGGQPFCAWCGAEREAWMALCRKDWRELTPRERDDYIDRDLKARAEWIMANKPKRRAS